jgi:hypothetical protein
MTGEQLSRRSALRLGASGLAAATTAGLAGCSSIPFLGGGGGGGSSTVQNWAYDPGEVADQDSYSPEYQSLSAIRNVEDELPNQVVYVAEGRFEQRYGDPLDVDFDEADWILGLGQVGVASVPHTVEDVVENLEDEFEFDEDDEVDGYTTVIGPSETVGYALDGSMVLLVQARDAVDGLEETIATQSGDVDMYVDEDEDFADAITNVDGDEVRVSLGASQENVVATGTAATFSGSETTTTGAQVFDEQDDVNRERFRELAREQDDLSVGFSGRVVTFERTLNTDEYTG